METLATALYVKIDDTLEDWPDLALPRPATTTSITVSDAELLTTAVMSALLGFTSERRWLRYVNAYLAGMFPRRIGQSGYNKRVRKAFPLFIRVIRMLAMDTSLRSDDVRVVDSTPVQCGCTRETATRSDAAGWAEYGTARRTPGTSGGCGCTWCAPCTGSRCCSPSPAPGRTSGRFSPACSKTPATW
jgi:hypothetical protein